MRRFWGGVLLLALILLVVCFSVSCDDENGSIEDYISQYCILEPFEDNYAQVTFRTSDMIYPSVCTIDGKEYVVAVINGFENPEDARALTGTLEIKDGIMAVNSNAFAAAENVTEVVLPSSCQSLGTNSLPPNSTEITLNPEAAKDLQRAISNKDSLNTVTIVGSGVISFEGEFRNLKKVQIVGEDPDAKVYWTSLPSFPDTDGSYFDGWYDSNGNKIVSGAKITNLNTTVTVNSKQYYLYDVATPRFSSTPIEPEEGEKGGPSSSGFNIPYFILASEAEYSFTFTDLGEGRYVIKPNTTTGVEYDIALNSRKIDPVLNENSEWLIIVDNLGTYTFTCSYRDPDTGEDLGFGQITFTYQI